ncbi:MAG: argininosuccinate lyase [Anaerolineae bacterium]|nr:argininosuccinate lyase [Anaerolineae bacterium]
MSKLWGGRFEDKSDPAVERFTASISFDQRLWQADIRGSIAWAEALAGAGLLSEAERVQIIAGLQAVADEWEAGIFVLQPGDEDIHTANERRLAEKIGEVAGKLHTGRSRNDQVVTDVRLWLREEIAVLRAALVMLQRVATERAAWSIDLILPGYTHIQRAQPVRFAHWLMAYFWMWQRDRERLDDLSRRMEVCPLGSSALAGTPFAIDRQALAAALGFRAASENSMDAVSDRDFIAEFLAWAALLSIHLSRLAGDLTLWTTAEFGFAGLADAHATGSSIMPQKKNPDPLELARGKAGRLIGDLTALLTTLKGLPLTYNSDLQEDKERLFDAVDTLEATLPVIGAVLAGLRLHPERMAAALSDDLLATDLADYLVRRGIPFRQSHRLVGQAIRRAEAIQVSLRALPPAEYQALSPAFGPDLYEVFDFERSVEQRATIGGTARDAVLEQIRRAGGLLEE